MMTAAMTFPNANSRPSYFSVDAAYNSDAPTSRPASPEAAYSATHFADPLFLLATADRQGNTLLHKAAQRNDVALVEWLIVQGAQIDAVNLYGNTPLHCAILVGAQEAARRLRERGADAALLSLDLLACS